MIRVLSDAKRTRFPVRARYSRFMTNLTPEDYHALAAAAQKLETQSYAMQVASTLGMPVETLLHMLPASAQRSVGTAVQKALEQCLRAALTLDRSMHAPVSRKRAHTAAVAFTGAVGGFFGLPGMVVELPISTTLMLHSIAEIARTEGEDLRNPESALACLEVFALGPEGRHREAIESAYYATRSALAQVTREAASYIVQKGTAKGGAPAIITFLSKIASRFGIEVSEKVAAELVPIAGSVGGLALNVLFIRHFQSIAEGHFTVRRLERKYGAEAIRQTYLNLRAPSPPRMLTAGEPTQG
jgi:hypothetical protein